MNFLKLVSIVSNELTEALRQIFVDMWDTRIAPHHGNQVWDDSTGVRILLFNSMGRVFKIPKYEPFKDWHCSVVSRVILHARTFALPHPVIPGMKKTLYELFLRNRVPVPAGSFHSSVASPSGDKNETTALATDQLRLLGNTICRSPNGLVDKVKFDDYVKYAKEAFTAVNVSTKSLETIGNLPESHFPTAKVKELKERLQSEENDNLENIKETTDETNKNVSEIKKKMDELLLKQETKGMLPSFLLLQNQRFFSPVVSYVLEFMTANRWEFREYSHRIVHITGPDCIWTKNDIR